jgi:hypothetical protein
MRCRFGGSGGGEAAIGDAITKCSETSSVGVEALTQHVQCQVEQVVGTFVVGRLKWTF